MASQDLYNCDVGAICDKLSLDLGVLSQEAKNALKDGMLYEVGIWRAEEGYMGVVEVQPGHTASVCTPTIAETLEFAAESVLGDLAVFAEDGVPFKQPAVPSELVREMLSSKPYAVKAIALCYPSSGGSTARSSADGELAYLSSSRASMGMVLLMAGSPGRCLWQQLAVSGSSRSQHAESFESFSETSL